MQATIATNGDVDAFREEVAQVLSAWWAEHKPMLTGIKEGTLAQPIIETLSEDLLARFRDVPLLDAYDVYQELNGYWAETMQDDAYLVLAEGWLEAAKPRSLREIGKTDKGKPKYEEPDLVIGSGKSARKHMMDLVPPDVIVAEYLPTEREALDQLALEQQQAAADLAEYVEEHCGDGGALEELAGEAGKLTQEGSDRSHQDP